MPTRFASHSPLPLAVAALFTLGFVGCLGETRSLNSSPGNGGEEGNVPEAGTGGRAGAAAGKGGGAHAGTSNQMGTGGRSETGGSSGSSPRGGSSFAGSAGVAGTPNGGAAGSPNGGVPNGGAGAMAGSAGNVAGGPFGGSAGGAGYPGCVVQSVGSGCDSLGFCVDHPLDSCAPDTESSCSGNCAAPYLTPICSGFDAVECPRDFECLPDTETYSGTDPTSICVGGRSPECVVAADCADGFLCLDALGGKRCVPDRANCRPLDLCDSLRPTCPPGYAPADAQVCDYVCVPFQHCGCDQDIDCLPPSLCDRETSRCLVPLAPAPRCQDPFEIGPCDASVPVYAFVDGECQPKVYGGCEGNDNRFATLEECLASCSGMPLEENCRGTRKPAYGCLACGGGGGCLLEGQFCFEPCESSDDCTANGFGCFGGICQVGLCI